MSETSAPPSASATATEVSPGNYTSKQQIYDAMVAAGVCEVGSMTEYGCMDPSIVSVIGIEPQNEGMTCATRSDRKATNFNQIVLGDNWYVISTDFEKVPGLAEAVGGEEVTIDQFCSALGW